MITSDYILVFITTSSSQEAEKLGKAMVEKKLAACGNIISDIRSIFWWNNSIETEEEALLILKSRAVLFSELITAVKSLHSYEVPEIIGLPIIAGSKEYLRWIDEETQRPQAS
jgi:periplasmic divalent cation tolerance protein